MADPSGRVAAWGADEGGSDAAALTSLLAVARLLRLLLRRRLAVLLVLRATGALRRIRGLAAIHPAIAVGIVTAVALLAVVLMARVTLLGLTVLGMVAMSASLSMVLVLGMSGVLRLGLLLTCRLGRGRRDEGEGRCCDNQDGLHVMIS